MYMVSSSCTYDSKDDVTADDTESDAKDESMRLFEQRLKKLGVSACLSNKKVLVYLFVSVVFC